MKHIIKTIFLLFSGFLFLMASCKEDNTFKEIIENNPDAPDVIRNARVENLAGKAKITYDVPPDEKLMYIKAVVTSSSGAVLEFKSSYYNNSIIVEGFADTKPHEVKLYTISRSEVASAPVTVTVNPLEAPIWNVFKSLAIQDAFGGYNLTASNPSKSNIAILVLKKNEFNEYVEDNNKSVYTSFETIESKVRGLDTVGTNMAIVVRDRWGNKTDTLFQKIKPIFEQQLPVSNFKPFIMPGDTPTWSGTKVENMWDGKYGWPFTYFTDQVVSTEPHRVTFDTGVLAKLSRVWIRTYPEGDRYFYLTTMKRFEVYGSVSPSPGGALDGSWVLIGSYTLVKPSGLPYGKDSGSDQERAAAGFSWDINLSAPKVRYLRVRCLENFAGGTAMNINEIKVFGDMRQ